MVPDVTPESSWTHDSAILFAMLKIQKAVLVGSITIDLTNDLKIKTINVTDSRFSIKQIEDFNSIEVAKIN